MAQVQVNRGVLVALAGALGLSLLALAYLLGREAARTDPSAPPVPPRSAAPVAGTGAAMAAPSGSPGIPDAGAPGSSPAPALESLVPPGPAGPAEARDHQAGAVQAYFAALDRIAPGQLAGDPQALAQEMLAGLAKGDASGFDRLLGQAEEARRKVAALAPPAPCAAFHAESLAVLDENLALLRAIRRALEGAEGEGALGALVSRAQAAQARAEVLERADKALRARYGLTR